MKIVYFDNSASSRRSRSFVESYIKSLKREKTQSYKREILLSLAKKISAHLNVDWKNISFVPNSTYALNEIAFLLRKTKGKEIPIYLSNLEHSSNHLIWLKLFSSNINYFHLDSPPTSFQKNSIISFSSISNLEGVEIDLDLINSLLEPGHISIVDFNQTVQHRKIDLSLYKFDYLVFSAHKFFGPNGIGVVYSKDRSPIGLNFENFSTMGKSYLLDFSGMEAWIGELDRIMKLFSSGEIQIKEKELNEYFLKNFPKNPNVRVVNFQTKGCIFLLEVINKSISSHDYSFYLSRKGVIVRSGLSCSLLSGNHLDPKKVFRVSLNHQNTISEINFFFGLLKIFNIFDCL